jgi:hypothetical protein
MAIGNPSFDVFKLADEHNELRALLRDLCEKEIAPYPSASADEPGHAANWEMTRNYDVEPVRATDVDQVPQNVDSAT